MTNEPTRSAAEQIAVPDAAPAAGSVLHKRRMSTRNRILFFVTAWLIVLMPFLFWWNTWFGRQLSDAQLNEYLHDQKKPRHIQHALVQLADRMARHDRPATKYYPLLVSLASSTAEEIRSTDAWVMGQDNTVPEFHQALLGMLQDSSPVVRGNAALALVRFGDPTGRQQILALLETASVTAAHDGRLIDAAKPGTYVRQNGLMAKLRNADQTFEVRSPIAGKVRSLSVESGAEVSPGTVVAVVDPGADQVWEALRALYLIGTPEDLPTISRFENDVADIPTRVRQQAILTEQAIRQRAHAH
jgi:biotin carboxyl carrier protein